MKDVTCTTDFARPVTVFFPTKHCPTPFWHKLTIWMIPGAQLLDLALQMNINAATKMADRTLILPQVRILCRIFLEHDDCVWLWFQ